MPRNSISRLVPFSARGPPSSTAGLFAHECLIFEVCQPQQAKKVLDQDMSVYTALPCGISIYEEGGKVILATLKPTTLLAMFDAPQLEEVAQEAEDTIVRIMKEAASG